MLKVLGVFCFQNVQILWPKEDFLARITTTIVKPIIKNCLESDVLFVVIMLTVKSLRP